MSDLKKMEEPTTLMAAYERLSRKCSDLGMVTEHVKDLNKMLQRRPLGPEDAMEYVAEEKQIASTPNIVELFNHIYHQMDEHIISIAKSTEESSRMIE